MIWFYTGLGSFGFAVGTLIGLSERPILKFIISHLFVFVGGSLIGIIKKVTLVDFIVFGKSLFAFSIFLLVGVLAGLLIKSKKILPGLRRKP